MELAGLRSSIEEVLRQEPKLWDRHQVENNPSLFYQAYFLDQQKISDVRSKGTLKIQRFNVKVTRQAPKEDSTASSKATRTLILIDPLRSRDLQHVLGFPFPLCFVIVLYGREASWDIWC